LEQWAETPRAGTPTGRVDVRESPPVVDLAPITANGRKTACPQNHPYDEANTYLDPRGRRHCRACRRESTARARAGTRAGSVDVTTPAATQVARAVVTHPDLNGQLDSIATDIAERKDEHRLELADLYDTRDELIFTCVEAGLSRRHIADWLGVSHTTVLNIISGCGGPDEDGDLDEDGAE
jgi:hypothetical protein